MGIVALTFAAFVCFYAWLLFSLFATRMKLRPRIATLAEAEGEMRRSPKNSRKRTARLRSWGAEKRARKFNEGMPDMLGVISNSLKAGHSFAQALHMVVEDLEGPIQVEMKQVEYDVQIGFSMEDALDRAADRIMSEDFGLVAVGIRIQRQVGGNLAEVLDKAAGTIRDRVRIEREVKMLTAQGRLSGTIFMLLPVGIGLLLFTINPAYMGVMFTSSLGILLLLVAAVGQLIGFFFIRKIVRVSL